MVKKLSSDFSKACQILAGNKADIGKKDLRCGLGWLDTLRITKGDKRNNLSVSLGTGISWLRDIDRINFRKNKHGNVDTIVFTAKNKCSIELSKSGKNIGTKATCDNLITKF